MKTICEICGKYSENNEKCTNCGASIQNDDEISSYNAPLVWGWAVFRFDTEDLLNKERAINYFREKWSSFEKFTVLSLLDSQLFRFAPGANEIRVIVREDFYLAILSAGNQFQGISAEFIPINFNSAEEANEILRKNME